MSLGGILRLKYFIFAVFSYLTSQNEPTVTQLLNVRTNCVTTLKSYPFHYEGETLALDKGAPIVCGGRPNGNIIQWQDSMDQCMRFDAKNNQWNHVANLGLRR